MLALLSTLATVFAIVVGVDADAVAVGLTCGAGRLNTLAFVAVVLAGAIFDLIAELKASPSVLHADLVLAGHLGGLRCALVFAIFALGVGAVGDTLVVVAFFKVFADRPTFAGSPHTSFAFLGSLDAGFAIGGKAAACVSWSALEALVFNTGGFALFGAVFILETFHTTPGAVALLAGRTIFVRATDTLVVLGALFGGAGVRLTMCIFETRDTLSFAARAVQQTTVRAVLTSRDGDSNLSPHNLRPPTTP